MFKVTVKQGAIDPLALTVDQNGGVEGLTCTVKIVDPFNGQAMDWADLTFKAAGHTTINGPMTDSGGGLYLATLDLSAVTNLTAAQLVADYHAAGDVTGTVADLITIEPDVLDDENADTGVSVRQALREIRSGIAGKIVRTGNVYAYRDAADSVDLFRLEDNDTTRDPV